jgi:hypothetical protein
MAAIIAALPFVLLLVAYHELPRIPVMRSSRFLLSDQLGMRSLAHARG